METVNHSTMIWIAFIVLLSGIYTFDGIARRARNRSLESSSSPLGDSATD